MSEGGRWRERGRGREREGEGGRERDRENLTCPDAIGSMEISMRERGREGGIEGDGGREGKGGREGERGRAPRHHRRHGNFGESEHETRLNFQTSCVKSLQSSYTGLYP